MARSKVKVNQVAKSAGRPLPGFSHYSSLIFYGTAPVVTGKWKVYPGPPSISAQQLFSPTDATNAGIIPFTDNTAATGTYTITSGGATGDTAELKVALPIVGGTSSVSLGVYTVGASETTPTLQAAALAAKINAGTITHGFSATSAGAIVTYAAPKSAGISLNSGSPVIAALTGTIAGTIAQFSNGTKSDYAIWMYHIKRFFVRNPKGVLWIGIISAPSSFNEIKTIQAAANNLIRQVGIYDISTTRGNAANITGTALSVHNAANALMGKAPLIVSYSPNIHGLSDLSTYPNQNLNTANLVNIVISEDGGAEGALLHIVSGQSIGNIGEKIGSWSASRISASDAQAIDLFNNASDGVENNIPAFSNGLLSTSVSEGLQDQLADFNYTFFQQFGSTVVGSYWIDNKMAVNRSTSQYANANDNRVSQEAQRIMYDTYTPELQGEIFFKDDGTMQDYYIESLIDKGHDALDASFVTGFGAAPLISSRTITIDPTQKIQVTEDLEINLEIVRNGIARNITINVSYPS